MTGYGVVRGCGIVHMFVSNGRYGPGNSKPIDGAAHTLPTNRDNGSGSRQVTANCGCPAGSSHE
ncbi:hypothetical protein M9458_044948, partial [Cirrhinus mrigala]